jgi:hypothetical protein
LKLGYLMFQVASAGGKHKNDEMTPLREAKQLAATGMASQKSVQDMALAAAWTAMAQAQHRRSRYRSPRGDVLQASFFQTIHTLSSPS